jgi:hypothetical protein
MALLEVIANAARQAIKAGRANFLIRPDNDGADAPPFLNTPGRQMMRQEHESLIPFLIPQYRSLKMWSPALPASSIAKSTEVNILLMGRVPLKCSTD